MCMRMYKDVEICVCECVRMYKYVEVCGSNYVYIRESFSCVIYYHKNTRI